jgi:fatty acyl-CoA reductase
MQETALCVCAQVKTVYLLVRAKKFVPAAKRVQELLCSPLFNMVHQDILNGRRNPFSRVHPVEGDLTKPSLGLTHQDLRLLRAHVNLVLHCGASIELEADVQQTLRLEHLNHGLCVLKEQREWCQLLQI